MFNNLPQFVSQETCLSCDGCCRFAKTDSSWRPKVAEEEIDEHCRQEIETDSHIRAVEHQDQAQCVFLNGNNKCRVYEHRPFQCRLYPFLLMKKGDELAIGVHLSCPYIQDKWQSEDFNSYVESLQRYFRQQEVLEFARRNQTLFDDYSGCEQEIESLFKLQV